MDAVERLQDLKQRREALIAQKAGLQERVKQNKRERADLQDKLKELGVEEGTLADTLKSKREELEQALTALDESLRVEESKVEKIQEQLGKV